MLVGIVAGLLAGAQAPSHRVTGIVVDDSGQPVINAAVALISESYTLQWSFVGENTRTGPDGRFAIEGVASGVYWVTAAAPRVTTASAADGSRVTVQNNGDIVRVETRNGTTTEYRFYYADQREITVASGPALDLRVVAKRR